MTHRRFRSRLGPYLEGDLHPRSRRRLEAHLEACSLCRQELASLKRTVELLRDLPAVATPPGLGERLLAQMHGELRPGLAGWLRSHASLLAGAVPMVAALALAVILAPRLAVTVKLGGGSSATSPPASALRARAGTPGESLSARGARERGTEGAAARRTAAFAGPGTPLPPRRACVETERVRAPECARWHAWMIGLALRDPTAFVTEMERVPSEQQEPWIRQLSSLAADAGTASLLATELRASGDPRAARLAPRFERATLLPRARR